MDKLPNFPEILIVAIVVKNKLSWYISDNLTWILDIPKEIKAYELQGYTINMEWIDENRKNYLILDTNNITDFLNCIEHEKASTQELRSALLKNKKSSDDKSWILDYLPSFYINFDNKFFYSYFQETISYENYVPPGWKGEFRNFYDKVPSNQRFWIDLDGQNIFINN